MSGTRALMLRLNCRLGPIRGSQRFNALQIGSQGRAPHIRILRAFDVDQRRVRWIFNSPSTVVVRRTHRLKVVRLRQAQVCANRLTDPRFRQPVLIDVLSF